MMCGDWAQADVPAAVTVSAATASVLCQFMEPSLLVCLRLLRTWAALYTNKFGLKRAYGRDLSGASKRRCSPVVPAKAGTHTPCPFDRLRRMGAGSPQKLKSDDTLLRRAGPGIG